MKRRWRALAIALVLGTLVLAYRATPALSCASVQGIGAHPGAVPLAIALYALAIVVMVPRWMVIAASGLTFGAPLGVVVAQLGAWLGSCLCLGIARGLAREPVERALSRQAWYAKMAPLLDRPRSALWICFLLRVNPLIHFTFTSYAVGLAPIRFLPYAVGGFVGMLPMTFVVGWAGDTVGCALLDGRSVDPEAFTRLLAAGVIMTLVSLAPFAAPLIRRWRRGGTT